jgi:MGT family glycosyltransferase
MIARDRIEVRSAGTAEGEWDRFRESRSTTEGTRPLLYCSLGSHWSVDQGFLRKVLDVFVRRPGWDLVLGLGSKLDPEAMGPVPENALVLSWAPQLEILAVADGAITHGGITTINECIAYSVPMLVYSTEHVDQNGCAARIEYHGLGVVGDKNGDSPHDIERNIERLLSDSTIRENVSAMNRRLTEVERSGVAVSTVESLVGLGATAR